MRRRDVLKMALSAAVLAAPHLARAEGSKVLRFIPDSDLTITDPFVTAAYVTRMHAMMVFDTLYGQDDGFVVRPQMVAGHETDDGGKTWRLTLRDGLRFHDGSPVLARDVVASLRRWGRSDAFGQTLLAATDVLDAPSDKQVRFRLKAAFPLLPNALGKPTAYLPVIMPERLVSDSAAKVITEVVGSGPFRYVAAERVDGVQTIYARFDDYVPRPDGATQFMAGPKIAHLDRVEWRTIPDDATAAGALQTGQADWWERPLLDLLPTLRADSNIVVDTVDRTGFMGIIRFNHLQPPFDKPAVRRAMLGAIDQEELMNAVAGADRSLWNAKVGVFCPQSDMANDAGLSVLTSPRDPAATRRALADAGYGGELVTFLTPANNQATNALSVVAADQLRRAGLNVQLAEMDFGAWLTRRNNRGPVAQGGWNATATFLPGMDLWDPAGHLAIRGNGVQAWAGWPTSERIEALREQWFAAPDLAARQAIAQDIQRQVWTDVPYIPAGQWQQPTAYRRSVSGVLRGMPLFYNVTL